MYGNDDDMKRRCNVVDWMMPVSVVSVTDLSLTRSNTLYNPPHCFINGGGHLAQKPPIHLLLCVCVTIVQFKACCMVMSCHTV